MGQIFWNTDVNAPCCPGEIVSDDGRTLLIQTDWIFPNVASSFGWSVQQVQRYEDCLCEHGTDGTGMMHYEINVSQDIRGIPHHLFATHKRSILSQDRAKKMYRIIKARFPEPEFKVTVTECHEGGRDITEQFA